MSKAQMVCTRCGTVGLPKRHTPGSFGVELLPFLLFIIPGIVYGVWRLSARTWVCGVCMADVLVPVDSPMGKAVIAQTVMFHCQACGAQIHWRFCSACGAATER
jgi:hypothetical protein